MQVYADISTRSRIYSMGHRTMGIPDSWSELDVAREQAQNARRVTITLVVSVQNKRRLTAIPPLSYYKKTTIEIRELISPLRIVIHHAAIVFHNDGQDEPSLVLGATVTFVDSRWQRFFHCDATGTDYELEPRRNTP